ncbi:MAG TPA: calcium-binding protein [Rhizomicrobium sp.]|jgi:Ca2+-binding RTX toxin-like protein
MVITGTAGDDDLIGTSGDDIFDLQQGGDDVVRGLGGNDVFKFGAAFTAADHVDGGPGDDIIRLNGDYSTGLTLAAGTITAVEQIQLGAGHDYALATSGANVAAGATLAVSAAALAAGNALTFDGSAETNGRFRLIGGAGDDVLTGGTGADVFDLTKGGSDAVHGGAGDDIVRAGAAFDATDRIDGGSGVDTLRLAGDYSAGLTFGADTIANIARIQLAAGFGYSLTENGGNLTAGRTLTVDGASLTDPLLFDGSAETDGTFALIGGAGDDVLTGGAGNDTFDLSRAGRDTVDGGAGNDIIHLKEGFDPADIINGGAGNDTVVVAQSDTAIADFPAMTSVEKVIIEPTSTALDFTLGNGIVAPGQLLELRGSSASSGLNFSADGFDGPLKAVSSLFVEASFAGNMTNADILQSRFVLLSLSGDYPDLVFNPETRGLFQITLSGEHVYHLTENDNNVAPGSELTVLNPLGNALYFDGSAETSGRFVLHGGSDNNTLIGGGGNDALFNGNGVSGTNVAIGNGGNDTLTVDLTNGVGFPIRDEFDGGSGNDTLVLVVATPNTGFTLTLSLEPENMTSVENLVLSGATHLVVVLEDADVSAGQTLHVSDADAPLYFENFAETDGHYDVVDHQTRNTIVGGDLSDTITVGADSVVRGGGGADLIRAGHRATLSYDAPSDSTGAAHDTIERFVADNDVFQFWHTTVQGYDGSFTNTLDPTNLDASLAAAADADGLKASHAIVIAADANSQGLAGHLFLIVDANNDGHYTAGSDYLIDITGALDMASFGLHNFG